MLSQKALNLILNMVNSPEVNFPGAVKHELVEIDAWATAELGKQAPGVNDRKPSRLPADPEK